MARTAKPKSDKATRDREEYKRFLETAREVGADESPEAIDRAFKKVLPTKPRSKERGHG
jgi:cell fate (sporulation/competence/biofilm development) regulator YlbF (YheA/YmcA/DUF963 family)